MRLFFETADQARAFLAAVPLGIALAACLDLTSLTGPLRPLADAMTVLAGGAALMAAMLLVRDESLRLYHLLAVLCGAVIYTCGLGRLARAARERLRARKKQRKAAGKGRSFSTKEEI